MVGLARAQSKSLAGVLACIYILIGVEINRFDLHSAAYLWTAPAWLLWYLLARAPWRRSGAAEAAGSPSSI